MMYKYEPIQFSDPVDTLTKRLNKTMEALEYANSIVDELRKEMDLLSSTSAIELRTDDPLYPPPGRMWIRTDLMGDVSSSPLRMSTPSGIAVIKMDVLPSPGEVTLDTKIIYSRDNIIIVYHNNKLYLSENVGVTFIKSLDVSNLKEVIKYLHVFQDGTLLFCTHTKSYYSTDFSNFYESDILDKSGSKITLSGYDNFSAYNHDTNIQTVNGLELLVWGNYTIHDDNQYKGIQAWYTRDKGKTIKMAYRFRRPGEATSIKSVRHIHNVVINPMDKTFWMLTGDDGSECNFMRGTYDTSKDLWTWETVGSGSNFKAGNMVFYDNYAYWNWDVPTGGVIRCEYDKIQDINSHVQLFKTVNDCLDIVMSINGELIVTQSWYGGNDHPKNFWYSPDRINFYKVAAQLPTGYDTSYMTIYGVRPPNKNGKVIAGIINLDVDKSFEDWNLLPSISLDDSVRKAGFPNAFKPKDPTTPTDTIPPTVSASIDSGFIVGSASIVLTTDEQASIYYTIDGSDPFVSGIKYTSAIPINSTTTLKYYAQDMSGNKSSTYSRTYSVITGSNGNVTTGLVAQWTSKVGVLGTSWKNSAPNTLEKYTGTINGATIQPEGMTFSGAGDSSMVTLPVPDELKVITDVTMEFRVHIYNNPQPESADIVGYQGSYFIYLLNNKLFFELQKDAAGAYGAFPIPLNTPCYVTIVYTRDGTIKFYRNGTIVPNLTFFGARSDSLVLRSDLVIGKSSISPENNFMGVVDDIRIYNRALNVDEIKSNLITT